MNHKNGSKVKETDWGYDGQAGPDYWGRLAPAFEVCGCGAAQSPIDISGVQEIQCQHIEFNYQPCALSLLNDGHNILITYEPGSFIIYHDDRYELLQFHFHHPSEHTIDGVAAPMELHFVHADPSGSLVVVGVMVHVGGKDNPALCQLFDNLPAIVGEPVLTSLTVDASRFLPAEHHYYMYTGSLTTPPCTEGVQWVIMTEPIIISAAQEKAFARLYPANARPIQDLNDRHLFKDA